MKSGGKAKVREFDMSILVDQDIVRFDISVTKELKKIGQRFCSE
jgi:hypothetical protein